MWIFVGVVFAFQYISTYREVHVRQPDLQEVGFLFAMIAIPTCNLLSISLVMAWMNGGLQDVIMLLLDIGRDTEGIASQIFKELQRLLQ